MPKTTTVSPKELASQLVSPDFLPISQNVRQRVMRLNYGVLERMAERNPIVNAIIQKRCQQMRPFCRVAHDRGERGFQIVARGSRRSRDDEKKIAQLERFVLDTGWEYDEDREDDLADFVQYIVRDALVVDQNTCEIRRTKDGRVYDFWYVDPTTISRAVPQTGEMRPWGIKGDKTGGTKALFGPESRLKSKDVRYVQRDNAGKIVAQYTQEDLIFDYANKRSKLVVRGYGLSPLEMAIDTITTILFGLQYNKDLFVRDRVPKGFLAVSGDVNSASLRAIRSQWVNEMTGYGAKFKVPIVASGKDGVGMSWQSLGQSNRDMEYLRLMHLMISILCAVYSIDAAEIGIRTEDTAPVIGESGEGRIQESKDTGLSSLLAYTETYLNKIVRKVDDKYELRFVGMKNEDEQMRVNIRKARLETDTTIDELREEDGLEQFDQEWSKIPLNPSVVGFVQQAAQAKQMGGGAPGGAPSGPPEGGAPPEEEFGGEERGEISLRPEDLEPEAPTEETAKSRAAKDENWVEIVL